MQTKRNSKCNWLSFCWSIQALFTVLAQISTLYFLVIYKLFNLEPGAESLIYCSYSRVIHIPFIAVLYIFESSQLFQQVILFNRSKQARWKILISFRMILTSLTAFIGNAIILQQHNDILQVILLTFSFIFIESFDKISGQYFHQQVQPYHLASPKQNFHLVVPRWQFRAAFFWCLFYITCCGICVVIQHFTFKHTCEYNELYYKNQFENGDFLYGNS